MKLRFNKSNVVYILMILCRERSNGIFMNELIQHVQKEVNQENDGAENKIGNISRGTYFNYFREIEENYPDIGHDSDLIVASRRYVKNHPRSADKFFRKFNRKIFHTIFNFLEDNEYVEHRHYIDEISHIPGTLYFSLIHFLEIDPHTVEQKHAELAGDFRVFRPSLTNPGKILVSCARIESLKDGTLRYLEAMHFKNGIRWQRQILQGYAVSREGKICIVTKDSSTKFIQYAALYPVVRQNDSQGRTIVDSMSGIYTGTTANKRSGLFCTGVYYLRESFRRLSRYPVERWAIGRLKGYGLLEPSEVPEQIRQKMFDAETP